MKSLHDFLQRGVCWTGVVPAKQNSKDRELLATSMLAERAVRIVLFHMADRLSSSRPSAGLKLSRVSLGNENYSPAAVSEALAKLARAGLIKRVREGRKGCKHEELAKTLFNPALIDMACAWQSARHSNLLKGLRGAAADPTFVEVKIPLIWTDHATELISMRVSKDQLPKNGIGSFQNLETATNTHPPAPLPSIGFGV